LRALRFLAGFAAGALVWWWTSPPYLRLLATLAQPLLHIDRRFADAVLLGLDRIVRVTSASELPMAHIPADLLTYNLILLIALFATLPFTRRTLRAFGISLLVMLAAHVAGLLISVESTYALRMGAWSEAHTGAVGQNVWLMLELFYRIVGMFGVAFGCWWAARGGETQTRD
jgi:hypothetical protein